jgi:hypothetical protein
MQENPYQPPGLTAARCGGGPIDIRKAVQVRGPIAEDAQETPMISRFPQLVQAERIVRHVGASAADHS